MTRTQIGRLEVTVDGTVIDSIELRNGRSTTHVEEGFMRGLYCFKGSEMLKVAEGKARRQYGEEAEVNYLPQ
jgi:hypothetical protein